MLGLSELAPTVTPPGVAGATPGQMTCDCTIRGWRPGSRTSSSVLNRGQVTVFLARTSPHKGPRSSKLVWNPVFLPLSCTRWEEVVQTQRGQTAGVPFSKERLGSRGEAEEGQQGGKGGVTDL